MLERPWARVKDPTPIPAGLDEATLASLEPQAFAELLRDNLLPRRDRAAWHELWDVLDAEDDLADRALDVLEEFEAETSRLLADQDADPGDRGRAAKFLEIVTQSISRLNAEAGNRRQQQLPLQWAGRRAEKFNPLARRVIEQLVLAIDQHRTQVLPEAARREDEELWMVLREVRLDPAGNGHR